MNNWKRKKYPEKEKDLNWMGHFKIESRYLKLRYDFRAFIRCMKTAWYRLGYLKFLMCLLIKRIVRAFISNIRPSIWTFSPAFEALGRVFKTLLGFQRKEKARLKVWKIYAACLCYNTAHTAHLATVMRISWTLINANRRSVIDLCTLVHYSCALFFHILFWSLFKCCIFSTLCFFLVILFWCYTLFVLYFGQVALF